MTGEIGDPAVANASLSYLDYEMTNFIELMFNFEKTPRRWTLSLRVSLG